jgi:hypothetical protein
MNVTRVQLPVQTRPKKVCHCSYCFEAGHNIKTCNHSDLKEFHRNLRNKEHDFYVKWGPRNLNGNSDTYMYRFYYYILKKMYSDRNTVYRIDNRRMNYTSESLKLYLMNHNIPKKTLNFLDYIIHAIVKLHCCSDASETEYKALLEASRQNWVNEENQRIREEANQIALAYTIFTQQFQTRQREEKYTNLTIVQNLIEYENTLCECDICMEEDILQSNKVTLNCNHELCKDCFKGVVKTKLLCPMCRTDISTVVTKSLNVTTELQAFKQSI